MRGIKSICEGSLAWHSHSAFAAKMPPSAFAAKMPPSAAESLRLPRIASPAHSEARPSRPPSRSSRPPACSLSLSPPCAAGQRRDLSRQRCRSPRQGLAARGSLRFTSIAEYSGALGARARYVLLVCCARGCD
eukprot:2006696-Pleurochrysis_carterae.AAC.1